MSNFYAEKYEPKKIILHGDGLKITVEREDGEIVDRHVLKRMARFIVRYVLLGDW